MSDQPIASKSFDRVHAAIWRNEGDEEHGSKEWYSATIDRNYRDANGQWRQTSSFTQRDLPHLKLAANWVMRELLMKAE